MALLHYQEFSIRQPLSEKFTFIKQDFLESSRTIIIFSLNIEKRKRELEDKLTLQLINIKTGSPETARIFNHVENACERLNIYAMDFFETIEILSEREESGKSSQEEIEFVKNKIRELNSSMTEISESMPDLVKLVKVN